MAADNEIKVLLTADMAQLQAGMQAGAASVEQSTEAMKASIANEATAFNAAVQSKVDAMVRLNAAFADSIGTTEAVAEAEGALDQAMAAGAITASEYAGYVGRLEAAEADMAISVEAATIAIDENTAALTINGGVAREVGVLIGELARGNYARLEGSSVTLANRTGLLSSALAFLASPAGAAAAAVAALGVAAYEAADDEQKLEEAIINTGHAAGMNADQMRTMEQALRSTGATASQAREAVVAVAASGNLLGANFQNAAQAAVDMAQLTGVSIDKAVTAISRLQEDPVKAIMKLNETMNFLSPTEAAEIRHLQDIGDKAGAASLAISDLADAERKRSKEQNDEGDGANSFTGKLKASASAVWAGAKELFSPATLKQQLDEINKEITQYAADSPGAITQDDNNKVHVDQSKMRGDLYEQVNRLLQQRADIQSKITAEDEKQEAVSAQVAANKAKVNAELTAPKPKAAKGGADTSDQAQADRDAYNAERLQHDMSIADEKAYWQAKMAAASEGTQAYRQAVQQLLEIKNKEASESRAVDRQALAEAKSAQAEKVRAAQEAAREQQRIALQLAQDQQRAAQDEARSAITGAQSVLAIEKEKIQARFALGQSSAQQETAELTAAYEREYQVEVAALQREMALLATKPKLVAQINHEIEKAQQQHDLAMQKLEDKAAQDNQKMWQDRLKPVSQAFNQSINGMIQGTQTLRQSLAGIGDSIAAKFIQMGLDMVVHWTANELAKTTATTVGAASRTTVEATAAAATKASDAATGKSQITSAAATGAAKAYQAIVGIPYVGPVLAPIAAGVAFAGIEAFSGMISSARGGWERVPFDGAMTELHKDEMVLPAHIANPMRQMAQRGGQGGSQHITINANDPRGFKDMLRRNPGALADAMKYANRRGHFAR
jgi:phage-related minor tail protein